MSDRAKINSGTVDSLFAFSLLSPSAGGEVSESEEELELSDKEEEIEVEDSAVVVLILALSAEVGSEEFCDERHMYRC
jgi:hypothetical protein